MRYTFNGIGSQVSGPVWRIGLMARKVTSDGSGTLEDENTSWIASSVAISNDDEMVGPNQDADVRVPLVSGRSVARSGRTYSTSYSYGTSNFNDYGRANSIAETGELTRSTSRTFQYSFAPYIVDRLASETVTVSGSSFTKSWGYDSANGFRTSETVYGIPTYFANGGRGNVGTVMDAVGKSVNYTYFGGMVQQIATAQYTIDRGINSDGTVAWETRRGLTTNFGYDTLMRPTSVAPPLGNTTYTTYDNSGGTYVDVNRGPSGTRTFLDGFGRPTGSQNQVGIKTSTGYDACGRVTYQSYPFTGTNIGTSFTYDGLDRLRQTTNPDGTRVAYAYSAGIDVTITDELNKVTVQNWSAFGSPEEARLVQVTANSQTTTYSYNTVGSLTGVSLPGGVTRSFSYYTSNLLQSEAHPESGTTTYTYYANGKLQTRDDAQFAVATYSYDGNNRLTNIDRPGTTYDVTIGYDESDNRTSIVNGHTSNTYDYDNANRATFRTYAVTGGPPFGAGFGYDGNDNLTTITYPTGLQAAYAYDAENRTTSVTRSDASGTFANGFSYHPSGAVLSFQAGNGLTHTLGYDNRYRQTSYSAGPAGLNLGFGYGYDGVGNVTTITDSRGGAFTQGFGYDNLHRLTSVTGLGAGGFSYDAVGNRMSKTIGGTTVSYGYHASTQRLTTASAPEADALGYDANGNLATSLGRSYAYTPENMMETATVAGVTTTTYRYDGDNLRRTAEGGGTTRYYLQGPGNNLLSELRQCGAGPVSRVADYVYAGSRLVAALKAPVVTVELVGTGSATSEGLGPAPVRVRVVTSDGSNTPFPVTVNYKTEDGTAVAPGDYTAMPSGSLTFLQGTASNHEQTIHVTLNNDAVLEADETFRVQLTSISCGGTLGLAEHTVTIEEDDPTVQLVSTASNHIEEDPDGTASVQVLVTTPHGRDTTNAVTLSWNTAVGGAAPATPGADYTPVPNGSLNIGIGTANNSTRNLDVTVIDDPKHEPDQTFLVNRLGISGGGVSGPPTHTVTIISTDPPPTVSISDAAPVTEGDTGTSNATFTVSLSVPSEFTVALDAISADGSALAGSDYWPRERRMTFIPEAISLPFTVPVIGDWINEGTEQFLVNLANPTYSTIGDGQGVATVLDNDAPGLSVADVYATEGDAAFFTVTLSPPNAGTVTVDFATADGTANGLGQESGLLARDYEPRIGTITFAPNVTKQQVTVVLPPDTTLEGPEHFFLNLSNAVSAPIVRTQAKGWIAETPAGVDFDANWRTDLVFRHAVSGENVVWFMDGVTQVGGTFTTPSSLADPSWKIVGTGNFDTDGKSDLLWQHAVSGEVVVWFMDGVVQTGGTFTTPRSLADQNWRIVGTGDFNRDGHSDILWHHQTAGQAAVVIWYMNGTVQTSGTFTTPSGLPDTNWKIVGTGDFNLDGKVDIVWSHLVSRQHVVWYMNDATLISGTFLDPEAAPGPNWTVALTRDFNRDGKTDIVWRHSISGQIVVWYMDGPLLTTGTFTTPPALDVNWRLVGPR